MNDKLTRRYIYPYLYNIQTQIQRGWSVNYGSLLMEDGHDNLLFMLSSPSLSGLMSSTCFQLSSIELSLRWAGVRNFKSSLEPLGVIDREEWPTRSFWRVEKDSLIADMASKNRVQEASAAGIGRSISFMKITRAIKSMSKDKRTCVQKEIWAVLMPVNHYVQQSALLSSHGCMIKHMSSLKSKHENGSVSIFIQVESISKDEWVITTI